MGLGLGLVMTNIAISQGCNHIFMIGGSNPDTLDLRWDKKTKKNNRNALSLKEKIYTSTSNSVDPYPGHSLMMVM